MSIEAIRTRLVSDLGTINGVATVYKDEPVIFPTSADMPAFILSMRDPMVTVQSRTNSSVEYMWHFDLVFLLKPEGLGTVDENMSALEDFIKLTIDTLYANFSGGNTWSVINKDTGTLDFSGGIITRANAPEGTARVWGWTGILDVTEFVETTMSSGT